MPATISSRAKFALAAGTLAAIGLYFGAQQVSQAAQESAPAPPAQRGELVYVPIYSSVFYENGKQTLELAATLSIHNISPDAAVRITRADYYNTEGKLIKRYLPKPLTLSPLQTTNLVVERADTRGGTGANFLVEWRGDDAPSPLIEAVMLNATSNLGIALTSQGKVVRKLGE